MMYTSKGRKNDVYAIVMFLLFTLNHGYPLKQQYNPSISPFSIPERERDYMQRKIMLSSPFDTNEPYKRLKFYHMQNGQCMVCQDECINYEPCEVQTNFIFMQTLQKLEQIRSPNSKRTRRDLQLTIIQMNDHDHASNLRLDYYIIQVERATTPTNRTQHDNDPENPPPGLEDSFSERLYRSKDLWGLTERDLNAGPGGILQEDNRATVQENMSTEKTEKEESIERKHELRNMRSRQPQPGPGEKAAEEVNQLAARLILGTDQKGQKHLVHVVPADYPTTTMFPAISLPDHPTSSQFVEDQATHSNNTFPEREKQTYQQIFRRVFDSLNTHRQSIDSFLESPSDNVDDHRLLPSMDNMEVARFSSNNHDVNHKDANFNPLHFNDVLLSSFDAKNENKTGEYEQYKNKYDNEHVKQDNY